MTPLRQFSSSSLLKPSSTGNEARDGDSAAIEAATVEDGTRRRDTARGDRFAGPCARSRAVDLYSHPWTQILLISFMCFCLPGVRLHKHTHTQTHTHTS